MEEKDLRRYSRVVVDGVEQAPSRAMLRAVGFEEKDFERPQIGIASTWSMITPCNMHIGDLAKLAALGADAIAIGRPYLWGLGSFGQEGVETVLDLLKRELEIVMRQARTTRIEEITRNFIA